MNHFTNPKERKDLMPLCAPKGSEEISVAWGKDALCNTANNPSDDFEGCTE